MQEFRARWVMPPGDCVRITKIHSMNTQNPGDAAESNPFAGDGDRSYVPRFTERARRDLEALAVDTADRLGNDAAREWIAAFEERFASLRPCRAATPSRPTARDFPATCGTFPFRGRRGAPPIG